MLPTTFPPVALLPATLPLLEALERDRAAFGAMIGSAVPAAWPEFPESIGFIRERLAEHPEHAEWWMYFFIDPVGGALLGNGGFAGPPRDRTVEIGYQIAPAFRGRRLGIGAAAALVGRAAATNAVDSVIAHTLPAENASTGVLRALGFERDRESVDPDEGPSGGGVSRSRERDVSGLADIPWRNRGDRRTVRLMSDTTSRGDDALGEGFDQTNDMVGGLEGESGGTAAGDTRSSAEEDEGGGGLLDDLHEGRTDPYVSGATHIGSTAAGEERAGE